MSRIAIIDLGTNTFNFLLAEKKAHSFTNIYETKISVKLGEGGINKGYIAEDAFKRGIDALKKYRQLVDEYKADEVYAIATSAIRGASNGDEFVLKAKEEAGIHVKVISGDTEAELIYHGVKKAVTMDKTPSLILDIGGGSTEFIIATNDEIIWKQSFLLGIARLLDRFNPSDPITIEEIKKTEQYLEENLAPLTEAMKQVPCHSLIGSSGSFDTFADMISCRFYTPDILNDVTSFDFKLDEFETIHQELLLSTREGRMKTKGLINMRVDMIVLSSIFVHFIIKKFNIHSMRLSTYSLKEGVLWST